MAIFLKIAAVTLLHVIMSLVIGWVGWQTLEEFELGFGTWFGMAFVAIFAVRVGTMIEEFDKDLTNKL